MHHTNDRCQLSGQTHIYKKLRKAYGIPNFWGIQLLAMPDVILWGSRMEHSRVLTGHGSTVPVEADCIPLNKLTEAQRRELQKRIASVPEKPGFAIAPLCFSSQEGLQIVINYIPRWTRHQCELLGLRGALSATDK